MPIPANCTVKTSCVLTFEDEQSLTSLIATHPLQFERNDWLFEAGYSSEHGPVRDGDIISRYWFNTEDAQTWISKTQELMVAVATDINANMQISEI